MPLRRKKLAFSAVASIAAFSAVSIVWKRIPQLPLDRPYFCFNPLFSSRRCLPDATMAVIEQQMRPAIDVLTATATDLQKLLTAGTLRSLDLVDIYLDQIQRHNHQGLQLNAMISVAPREDLLRRAAELDIERQNGSLRGPLHGIPVTVKVSGSAAKRPQ